MHKNSSAVIIFIGLALSPQLFAATAGFGGRAMWACQTVFQPWTMADEAYAQAVDRAADQTLNTRPRFSGPGPTLDADEQSLLQELWSGPEVFGTGEPDSELAQQQAFQNYQDEQNKYQAWLKSEDYKKLFQQTMHMSDMVNPNLIFNSHKHPYTEAAKDYLVSLGNQLQQDTLPVNFFSEGLTHYQILPNLDAGPLNVLAELLSSEFNKAKLTLGPPADAEPQWVGVYKPDTNRIVLNPEVAYDLNYVSEPLLHPVIGHEVIHLIGANQPRRHKGHLSVKSHTFPFLESTAYEERFSLDEYDAFIFSGLAALNLAMLELPQSNQAPHQPPRYIRGAPAYDYWLQLADQAFAKAFLFRGQIVATLGRLMGELNEVNIRSQGGYFDSHQARHQLTRNVLQSTTFKGLRSQKPKPAQPPKPADFITIEVESNVFQYSFRAPPTTRLQHRPIRQRIDYVLDELLDRDMLVGLRSTVAAAKKAPRNHRTFELLYQGLRQAAFQIELPDHPTHPLRVLLQPFKDDHP